MVETMRREGHTALVHTAAASNLGQMLNKICLKDGIGLVNIVRKPEQAALLRGHRRPVRLRQQRAHFHGRFDRRAGTATGATIAFDATGGGTLAGPSAVHGSRHQPHRQGIQPLPRVKRAQAGVNLYGHLDTRPTEIQRTLAWPGAWAAGCCSRSCKIGDAAAQNCASAWRPNSRHLRQPLRPHRVAGRRAQRRSHRLYGPRNTGAKMLIDPSM